MSGQSVEKAIGIGAEGQVLKGTRIIPLLLAGLAVVILLAKGIDWADSPLADYPRLSADGSDIRNLDELVEKLTAQAETDPVSRFLWRQFALESRQTLASPLTPDKLKQNILVEELNKVIESGYSIYGEKIFGKDLGAYTLKAVKEGEFSDHEKNVVQVAKVPVGKERHGLKFRVSYATGEHVDHDEGAISRRKVDLDDLKQQLERMFASTTVQQDLPVSAALVASALCDACLSPEIDREMRQVGTSGGDPATLNRLLLERAYPGEIYSLGSSLGQRGEHLVGAIFAYIGHGTSKAILHDVPLFVVSQVKAVGILALCALIPGLAGLVYRRAFRRWFLASFAALFLINWMFAATDLGAIGADIRSNLEFSYDAYLWVETALLLVLLAYGLRRHSAAKIDAPTRRNNVVLSVVLILTACAWTYAKWGQFWDEPIRILGVAVLLMVAYAMLRQTLGAGKDANKPGKNIVMCLDGTWNQPGTKDFGHLAETNVFKLFKMLKGKKSRNPYNASQCKEYLDLNQAPRQVGFYYHGVGNTVENSELGQLLGGAFGMGADAIVERAYLDVVRVYRPGDRIFIFGFSRGAAIARLLAGVIGRRDIPRSMWTLRLFGRHWALWKSTKRVDEDNPVEVQLLGCWDTVGAFGISKNILGIPFQKVNLLKNLTVSMCVRRAYHMVALDETRDSFVPTLMEPDPTSPDRVVEIWFSGNHSNVGGGYHTDRLSDVTLDFLLRHLSSGYAFSDGMEPGQDESWGLYLSALKKGAVAGDGKAAAAAMVINPDPRGQLRHATGPLYDHAPRKLPVHAIIYDSVFQRMREVLPVYAPQSLFNLNDELVKKREGIQTEVKRLVETRSLEDDDVEKILAWSSSHLSLTKWSGYLEAKLADGTPLREKLSPARELANPVRVPTISPIGLASR